MSSSFLVRLVSLWAHQLCLVLLLLGGLRSVDAATLPTGFAETQIAGSLNPTTMAFAPDGRLFLCEKQGRIRVVKNGAMLGTPLVDFSGAVDSWNERGLGSVCVDPSFASNGWVYVYYTAKSPASHNRVSRFTVSGDTASAGSELVLLDITNLSSIGWHNGGGLRFGKDGKLYISTGENANGANAQNTGNLLGKVLRLNKDGSIPSDNPNYNTYSGSNRAIVAMGLRNPFSIAVQPGTGLLYVNEVGASYEEINTYNTGAAPVAVNYGWPGIDGRRTNQTAPSGYRDPTYPYDHGSGEGTALCGGDFYNPASPGADAFPSTYSGRFFFSDYRGWIKYIDPANPDTRQNFATNIARPIDVEVAPDGSLWYIARAGQGGGSDADNGSTTNGSLWRVRWIGGGGPSKLAFSVQPVNTGSGAIIAPAVKVTIQDTNGNPVTSAINTITMAIANNPASGTLSGTLTVAAVGGVATFSNLSLNNAGTGYTLRATSGSLTAATSEGFNVTAQATAPVISPNGGSFSGPVWVQLSSATPGATIRYTTDGATPTTSSASYGGPFQITGTRTVKAIAQKSGLSDSGVASTIITITGSTAYGLDYRPVVTGVTMPTTVGGSLPGTLSSTGLFSNMANLTAKPGVVPYSVNSALWSDNAQKQRWVALPGSSKVAFAPTGEYTWPGGTVFIKHFELVTNEVTQAKRRLETRVLVLDATGGNGYGVTYKWRGDNSEADLVTGAGQDESITITTSSGSRTQVWHYPSRDQCLQCHTTTSGFVLGPKTRQLNGTHAYPTGRSDNQVRTWSYLQMFTTQVNEGAIGGYSRMVKVDDGSATLENRVRSYLDANCANCHRPGGTGAQWDARYDTPLANQNIIGGAVRETFGISGAQVVAPAEVPKSIMHLRMQSTVAAQQMPPLGRNLVDTAAVNTLAQWIGTLPPTSGGGGPQSGGIYHLTARHSSKRLEIIDNGGGSLMADGTKAQQWSARSSGQNQNWRLNDMGGGWWKMTNVASGKVLDVPGGSTANSVALGQFTDHGGTNQRWSFTDVGDGWFTITSQVSGKLLDVNGRSTADGAAIHQYQATGGDNQCWSLTLVAPPPDSGPISGGIYTLTAKHSGKALDVFDDGSGVINQNGTYVQQWTDHGETNQQWRLDDQGGGWWKLTNVRSGKCLDVPGGSTANSVALSQWTDNSGDNQRWSFIATGGGYYKVGSKVSGKYLDVAGASSSDGARINQYQDNGNDNQRWMLEMVAPAAIAGWVFGAGEPVVGSAMTPWELPLEAYLSSAPAVMSVQARRPMMGSW